MPSNVARYTFVFTLIHWVLVLMGLVLLGLGWYIQYIPQEPQARSILLKLHFSFGLTSAILLSIQLFLWIVFKPPSFHNEIPKWRKLLAHTLYMLIYVSFTLMLISGYLQAVFSGTPLQFWSEPLPVWGAADVTLAGYFLAMRGIVAVVLAGSIFVHVCIAALNIFKHPGIAARMLPFGTQESQELVLDETKFLITSKIAQSLAKNLHLFGWIEFWLQFVLALISALLLTFAASGRASSPGSAGFGDAIYWGVCGFLLLCFAVLLDFYYTRVARKVVSSPDSYLNQKIGPRFGFWVRACSPVF